MPHARKEDVAACSHRRYLRNKRDVARHHRRWRRDNPVRYAWLGQRHTSSQRGVEFELTFEEFEEFWGDDFPRRGRGPDELCMGRFGDEGPYRIGNIYVVSNSENKEGPRPLPEPDF